MVAFLLCAGFGTRMKPLTNRTPKSLVQVAGHPLLDYLVDELMAWDALDAVHLATNHRDAEAFRRWASNRREDLETAGITPHVHDDGVESPAESLGSVGDLHFLLNEVGIPEEGALVSGADNLFRFPLAPILNAYVGRESQVLAVYESDPEKRKQSGTLTLDGSRVTEVRRDPTGTASRWTCPAWFLLTPEALELVAAYLEDGGPNDRLDPLLHHIARTQTVRAVRLPERQGLRIHCNTMDDVERARRLFREEPRHVLDSDTVRQRLNQRES